MDVGNKRSELLRSSWAKRAETHPAKGLQIRAEYGHARAWKLDGIRKTGFTEPGELAR